MSTENENIDISAGDVITLEPGMKYETPPAEEETVELRTSITILYLPKRRAYCFLLQVPGKNAFRSRPFPTYGDAARAIIKLLK